MHSEQFCREVSLYIDSYCLYLIQKPFYVAHIKLNMTRIDNKSWPDAYLKISRKKKKRKIKNKFRSGVPPGESPGEKGQQGPLIVFEKGQKGRRNALYQNGQYVGLQSHMFTRLKPIHNQIYSFITSICAIYIIYCTAVTLYTKSII